MEHTLLFPVEHRGTLSFIPHTGAEPWPELSRLMRECGTRAPFFFGAPTDGLDTLFHLACLEACIPPVEGSPYKIPLARLVSSTLTCDALITQPLLAQHLLRSFAETATPVPFTHIFLFPPSPHTTETTVPDDVAQCGIPVRVLAHPLTAHVTHNQPA